MHHRRSILFLHPADEGYGADRVLYMAVAGLHSQGWTVRVLLPDDVAPGWLSDQLISIGIEVRRGPLAVARRKYFTPAGIPAYLVVLARARRFVRAAVREWSPSIIHVNTTALLVAAVLGRPNGARVVWHVHEIVVRPRFVSMIFRAAPMMTADRVIAISDAVRSWLTSLPFGRSKVIRIYNGIDPGPEPHRLQTSAPVVAFIGRLNRWKGVELFVDAAAALAPGHPTVTFKVVGDPPPGEEWRLEALQQRIASRGVQASVFLEGFRSDVPTLLSSIDIVVVPSVWPEPFGLITAEAMAAGCAVVASNHGAAPELLDGGRCGILVPPSSVHHLVQAVDRLLTDPGLRWRLGASARQRLVTQFGREEFVQRIDAFCSDLIS